MKKGSHCLGVKGRMKKKGRATSGEECSTRSTIASPKLLSFYRIKTFVWGIGF